MILSIQLLDGWGKRVDYCAWEGLIVQGHSWFAMLLLTFYWLELSHTATLYFKED